MSELMNELQQLQKKAMKYDDLMSRAREFATKLQQAAKLLQEVADELDPTAYVSRDRSGIDYRELSNEIYQKMQAGIEVGSDMLQAMYPDWRYNNIMMLLSHIKRRPNVDSRKEGRKIFYYCKREIR